MEEMVAKLKKPRRVMMLVKAGSAVDSFIDKLVSTPSTTSEDNLVRNIIDALAIIYCHQTKICQYDT